MKAFIPISKPFLLLIVSLMMLCGQSALASKCPAPRYKQNHIKKIELANGCVVLHRQFTEISFYPVFFCIACGVTCQPLSVEYRNLPDTYGAWVRDDQGKLYRLGKEDTMDAAVRQCESYAPEMPTGRIFHPTNHNSLEDGRASVR